MTRGVVILTLTFAFAASAYAAAGDPRLVQGTLEWPAKLTAEPFVVVRADDGRWYYAEIKSAKRLESAPLTAGTRVAVLGAEATRPHELTAIAIGSGDAAALAMALMPHVNPTASTAPAAPPASPAAESPSASKPVATETPQAPKPAGKPEAAAKPEPAASAPPPPAKASQPPLSDSAPSANLQVTAPATEKATPANVTVPSEPTGQAKPAASVWTWPSGTPRWAELQGTVHAIAGHWVVVRADDDGKLVLVDFSGVRLATGAFKPGSPISVYGTPGESKFQAMGVVLSEKRPPVKPVVVPQPR